MTKDEALRMALEALKYWDVHGKLHQPTEEAIIAIEEALAESEQESDWKDDVIQQHEKTILWQTKRIAELIRRLAAIMQHPE